MPHVTDLGSIDLKRNLLFAIILEFVQLNNIYMAFEQSNSLHSINLPNVINYTTITFHCHSRCLRFWTHNSYCFKSVFVCYHINLYLSLHRITNL